MHQNLAGHSMEGRGLCLLSCYRGNHAALLVGCGDAEIDVDTLCVMLTPLLCMLCCMLYMCPAAREHVVGWYSTGPRLREADLSIQQLLTNYCATPLLVICEIEVR